MLDKQRKHGWQISKDLVEDAKKDFKMQDSKGEKTSSRKDILSLFVESNTNTIPAREAGALDQGS
ncbi:hypothetical protein ANO14919_070710 [Xylariales sp. No.14919]|nr:hypothetical protein ANO14919_070710 [Xylariales sp. No.14919]